MKTRIVLFSSAAALVVILAVPFAFAQRDRGMHEHGDMMMFGHLQKAKEALGLSDQQMTDIQAIFQQLHDQNAQYRQQLHGGMQQILETLVKNPNDVAAAQALIDQQAESERAMKSNMLNAASKALNVLTPDQRIKLGDLIQQHMANRPPK
jgi:Spy/CpxP family protein refolding chaperone